MPSLMNHDTILFSQNITDKNIHHNVLLGTYDGKAIGAPRHMDKEKKTYFNSNVLVLGNEHTGKTTSFLIPNILNNDCGSMVVFSTDERVQKACKDKLTECGITVMTATKEQDNCDEAVRSLMQKKTCVFADEYALNAIIAALEREVSVKNPVHHIDIMIDDADSISRLPAFKSFYDYCHHCNVTMQIIVSDIPKDGLFGMNHETFNEFMCNTDTVVCSGIWKHTPEQPKFLEQLLMPMIPNKAVNTKQMLTDTVRSIAGEKFLVLARNYHPMLLERLVG